MAVPRFVTTRLYQARSSSSSKALARLRIGWGCVTGRKPSAGGAPTRWVGESGVTSAGCAASSARSSPIRASNASSEISGASSTW